MATHRPLPQPIKHPLKSPFNLHFSHTPYSVTTMDFFAQAYSERSDTPHSKDSPQAKDSPHTRDSPLTHPTDSPNTRDSPHVRDSPHAKDSPLHSPRSPEGTCRGYGSEANFHLRRASSGLEADVPRHSFFAPPPHGFVGNLFRHHDNTGRASPVPMPEKIAEVFHKGLDLGHLSFGKKHSPSTLPQEHDKAAAAGTNSVQSNSASASLPVPLRRASVSNPCLLKHVNQDGGGAVRPPMMPKSLSSSQLNKDDSLKSPGHEKRHLVSTVHEPTICEGRDLYERE